MTTQQPVVFKLDDVDFMENFVSECKEKGYFYTARLMEQELEGLRAKE